MNIMKDRNRGKQVEKREQIKKLLLYLESNKPVPLDIALPIAERLHKYLDREIDNIEDVLCRRERSDRKNIDRYDLGFLACCVVNGRVGEGGEDPELLNPSQEVFEALEVLSDIGADAIESTIDTYCLDEAEKVFENFCKELDAAREAGALTKEPIKASRWKSSYRKFRDQWEFLKDKP